MFHQTVLSSSGRTIQLVRAFGGNLLKSGPVSRSLTEDNVWAAMKALVNCRSSR